MCIRDSITRTSALSRSLSAYFKYFINGLLAESKGSLLTGEDKNEVNIVVVYSGGDDMFLVGAWDEVLSCGKMCIRDSKDILDCVSYHHRQRLTEAKVAPNSPAYVVYLANNILSLIHILKFNIMLAIVILIYDDKVRSTKVFTLGENGGGQRWVLVLLLLQ